MKINGKTIEIKKVTVGINEKFQSLLLEGATMGADGSLSMKVENTPKANIYLVSACTGIDEEEIRNEWTTDEFNEVLTLVNEKSAPSKKG